MGVKGNHSNLIDGMTNKMRILNAVQRWDDAITLDEAAYRLNVLSGIMEGLADVEAGRVHDLDQVFDELERMGHGEENESDSNRKVKKGSTRTATKNDRRGNSKDSNGVHKTIKRGH